MMVQDKQLRNARPHKFPLKGHDDSLYESPNADKVALYKDQLLSSTPTTIPESPTDVTGDKLFDAESFVPKTPSNKGTPSSTSKGTPSHNKKKCPCKKSDKKSTYIICNKCKQQWHNRCCNLHGLAPAEIKKMELWECPGCYVCPALGKVPASIYADIRSTKEVVTALCLSDRSVNTGAQIFTDEVTEKLNMLQQEIQCLRESAPQNVNYQPPDASALMSTEVITGIQNSLQHLTEQVSSMQSTIDNINISPPVQQTSLINRSPRSVNPHQPNTVSPHVRNQATPCKPYELYDSSALTPELKNEVLDFITANSNKFTSVGENSRDVLYFGDYSYRYTGTEHQAQEMPHVLTKVLDSLASKLPSPENGRNMKVNSCLISRYDSGLNHIPMHRDDEPVIDPESHIITLSLGATRTMSFCSNNAVSYTHLTLPTIYSV